ncbi:response regulator [Pseudomarimonas salicorniae]|uniref:Response regulator n=1 Tax=Pseudomarimonas salicorniae TaxID=2933270 RepID=A0ABT0GKJ1_9GAMM|nr:response regulator [Lysobacter sp. CAU 1642]MCK7595054.1 response regulator [Lysobacter sp. CAU 1642]
MSELQHVLCVEDEPDIRLIAQLALETVGGLRVSLCASGNDAVDVARRERPDLVVLDVMMPGLDGPGTLKALREHPDTAELPVVFMTAKVQPAEVAQLMGLGALAVVAKPFDPMSLATQLREIWSRR